MKRIKINNFEEKLYYEKLANGLEVYLFLTPKKKSYSAYFTTKFGGSIIKYKKDDKEYNIIPGTAHFLEHKLFEQENGESALSFYAKSGANVNAWTSKKSTTYYFEGCEMFEENLRYLINYVSHPYITDENVKKEKGIIKQEIRMYKDEPDSVLFERLYQNMFHNDSIKYSVAGEESDIDRITKESLLECYKTFYQPNNMFLIVSGNFKPKKILDLVKKEKLEKNEANVTVIKEEEPDDVVNEHDKIIMDIKSDKFVLAYKMNKKILGNNKYISSYYLDILLDINFGVSSSFREEMRKKNLFTTFYSYQVESDNHITIMFVSETDKTKKLLNEVRKKLQYLNITEEEFERTKKLYISSIIRGVENQETVVNAILNDIINYGKYYNQKIEDIKNLKYNELLKFINHLDFSHYSEVIISNK